MFLKEILNNNNQSYGILLKECNEFLSKSNGNCLLKNLTCSYNDFHKVKVRLKKKNNEFITTFNETFKDEIYNIRQRAVFANGMTTFIESNDDSHEPFFIFPINGFKFIYSDEVVNSDKDYQDAFETIIEHIGDKNVIKQLLKYTYKSENLVEGILRGSEIIIYNIPHFYAIRRNTLNNYKDFLETFTRQK